MLALQRTPRKRGEYRMFTSVVRFYERTTVAVVATALCALLVGGLYIPAAAVATLGASVIAFWLWVEAKA